MKPTTIDNAVRIEMLETRRLLAIFLHEGIVHGVGTNGNDELAVDFDAGGTQIRVTVNDQSAAFDADDVSGVHLWGAAGNDEFSSFNDDSTGVPVTHDGGTGNDVLDGSQGGQEDTFLGGNGDDRYQATTTNFPLLLFNGGAGRDMYVSPGTLVELDLNDHPGVEDASAEFGTIIGTDTPNMLSAGGGRLVGNGGNDVLTLHSDGGTMEGGEGDDLLTGDETSMNGTAQLGGAGNDTLLGTEGADNLEGGAGNDLINAKGNEGIVETLAGGDGDDTLIGSNGADNIQGGAGLDTVDYSARGVNLGITIDDVANDGERGTSGPPTEGDNVMTDVETVLAGSGNDWVFGNGLNNLFRGNGGNDFLGGFGGNDALYGGGGNDRLEGGNGNDYLEGNSGNDALLGEAVTDFFLAGDGDDWLYSRDGVSETVNGGNGFDRAQRDASDNVISIEAFLA